MSKTPKLGEQTEHQLISVTHRGNILEPAFAAGASYKRYREIRKDPTIALARMLITATVLSGEWSVECDDNVPDEMVKFIRANFVPIRELVIEAAMNANVDFGWIGFEKIFAQEDGRIVLKKLKPLLPDITEILIIEDSGAFAGFRQLSLKGRFVDLNTDKCLYIGFRVEGTQWYGYPLLENTRAIQEKWEAADSGAAQYDKHVAGSHFVVYYPVGQSSYNGQEKTDNGKIAEEILKALEASGSISIPVVVSGIVDELNNQQLGWKIEILEDAGGRQPTFIDRLKYLDALKCRGLGIPERAILEGEFGTKAEAGEHANMAITNIQMADNFITRHINWYCVDQLLALNFGQSWRGKVRLSPAPLTDSRKALLRAIYTAVLTNPQGFLEEFGKIDTDSIKDELGIPKAAEVAQAGEKEGTPNEGLTQEQRTYLREFLPTVSRNN